jgi:hypothetical protein
MLLVSLATMCASGPEDGVLPHGSRAHEDERFILL